MRVLAVLMVLAMCAGTARAANEVLLSIEGDVTPFTLLEQRATVRVDADCTILSGVPPRVVVELAVEGAPEWLEAFVEERTLTANPADCPASRTVLETELRLFRQPASLTPLAGANATLTIVASTSDLRATHYEARATLPVVAGLAGTVRVGPGELPVFVAPGQVVELTQVVSSSVNAPLVVSWTPDARGAGLGVAPATTTVDVEGEATARFTMTVPEGAADQSGVGFALDWEARTPEGSLIDRGTAPVAMLVAADIARPAPTGAGEPGGETRSTVAGPSSALLLVAAVPLAALLRARRRGPP